MTPNRVTPSAPLERCSFEGTALVGYRGYRISNVGGRATSDAIAHRGPDDVGYLLLNSRDGEFRIGREGFENRPCDVCLGCRRLAIIDLSANALQPARNETGDISAVTWCMDYPAVDGQVMLRWRLMGLAGRHVKVILEGQGADEMLAGYLSRYFTPYLLDELDELRLRSGGRVAKMKKLRDACLDMHRRHGWPHYALFLRKAWGSLRGNDSRPSSKGPFTRRFLKGCAGRPEAPWERKFDDRLSNRMHFDHAAGVLPLLLKYGDALSMAASIESRLPFLDHRLVEFVFRLPMRHRLDGSLSKGILRQAMAETIPERIRCRRDKIGFETPLRTWIGRSMESEVRPLLLSRRCRERGIFDTKRLERLLERPARGKARMEYAVFRWVSAELWFRLFIGGEALSPTLDRSRTG